MQIKKQGDRFTTYDRFEVKSIGYDDDGNINSLEIVNKSLAKMAYSMNENHFEEKPMKLPKDRVEALRNLCKKHNNMPEERIYKLYGKKKLEDLTTADREDFLTKWEQVTGDWMNESEA